MSAADATGRVAAIRARFRGDQGPVIGHGIARFAASTNDTPELRAVLPDVATRSVAHPAEVSLPRAADGAFAITDIDSALSARVELEGSRATKLIAVDGIALYPHAVDGADVVHRVHAEGTEDFVLFESRPKRAELVYLLDVAHVAGLRLVSNTLELLDPSGSPRLRVSPPFVVDVRGVSIPATLRVVDCAYDANPAAPWDRPVTAPGSPRCRVGVSWPEVTYPALVDPGWTATGSMVKARSGHTASLLASGKILVVGGGTATELYDPSTGTFAATGATTSARTGHAASVLASGNVLVTGGSGGAGTAAEVYDAGTGTFTAVGSMAVDRTGHTSTALPSGKVLVVGASGDARTEIYDPLTKTFAIGPNDSTMNRYLHTATSVGGGKVVIIGTPSFDPYTDELYDPATGLLTAVGDANGYLRHNQAVALLPSGKVLVSGGHGPIVPKVTTELYDPTTNSLTSAPDLGVRRENHTATLLSSGQVLIVGGNSGHELSSAVASTELYDPVANAFAPSVTMTTPRTRHTATRLPNDGIAVIGGYDGTKDTASAETLGFAPNGSACNAGAGCASGFCVDQVCCNTACTDTCQACDLTAAKGTCTTVSGTPHGKRACTGGPTGACAGSCDGLVPTTCAFPGLVVPCGGSCSGHTESKSTCDGTGSCVDRGPHSCDNSLVCANNTCKTRCETKTDCVDGFDCGAEGRCVVAFVCTDDHTSKSAAGASTDCGSYHCGTNGECKTVCTTVDDCVAPSACEPGGRCVGAADAAAEGGGSCAVTRTSFAHGAAAGGAAVATLGIGALFLTRRRRRREAPGRHGAES